MAVTVDSSAIVAGGSGNTGWSARSTFLINDVDQYNQTGGNTTPVGSDSSVVRRAMAFTTGSAYDLAAVVLDLSRTGNPSDNWTVTIETNATDRPSGSVLATSAAVVPTTDIIGAFQNTIFTFASPPSLSSGTKYWICLGRSGAVDGSNYLNWALSIGGDPYGGGGLSNYNGTSWGAEQASNDFRFICLKTSKSVYQVTQDAELHVWKSTDNGASFTEADAGNGPTVNSSTKPFSAEHRWTARQNVGGQGVWCGYFSNTNTARVRKFSLLTQTWDGSDIGGADFSTDVDFNRNIRVMPTGGEIFLHYTSLADDADLEWVRYDGSMGAQTQALAVNSTEASCFSDVVLDAPMSNGAQTARFVEGFYYDAANDDFSVRSLEGTTQGTETDLDATAAATEVSHSAAVYQVYDDAGTDKVIAAYIDSNDTLQERICSLGVTSASITMGTQHQVTANTNNDGLNLSTCVFNGNGYIFVGLSTAIQYFTDVGLTGTWSGPTNLVTSLTSASLSTALPITGVGVLVSYVNNGDTVVELFTGAVDATGTVASGTLSISGQSITGRAGAEGDINTGTLAISGQSITGRAAATGSVSTGTHTVSGQQITGITGSTGSVSTGSIAVSGQSITGISGSVGQVSTGALAVSGQAIDASEAMVGTVNTGSLSVTGQNVSGATGSLGSVGTGSYTVSGQAINGGVLEIGEVATGELSVSGQSITGTAGSTGQVSTGTIAISGQSVSGTTGSLGSVGTGSLVVSGQDITGTAEDSGDVLGVVDTGELVVSGQDITGTTGSVGSIATGSLVITTGAISGTTGTESTISTGSLSVTGQSISGTHTGDTIAVILTGVLTVFGNTHNGEFEVVAGGIVIPTDSDHIRIPPEVEERRYVVPTQRYVRVRTVPAARFRDLDEEEWP